MTLNNYGLTRIIKMLILAFKITCILMSSVGRYTPGAFVKTALYQATLNVILCILLLMLLLNVTYEKLLLLMQWLLYFDYYIAYVVILDMTSSTSERIPPFLVLGCDT